MVCDQVMCLGVRVQLGQSISIECVLEEVCSASGQSALVGGGVAGLLVQCVRCQIVKYVHTRQVLGKVKRLLQKQRC